MKKLLTLLMCFQFIIAPMPAAYAGDDPPPPTSTEAGSRPPETGRRNGDGHYETGIGSKGGYDFWVQQVLTMALSIFGTNMITMCPTALTKPSAIAFMAGSVIYIGSEIAAGKPENQRHKKNLDDIEMDESRMTSAGTQTQKDALKIALDEEQGMLEFVRKKRNWMIAITTVFGIASGLAIFEEVYANGAGATAALAQCTGPQAAMCANMMAGVLAANGASASEDAMTTGNGACGLNPCLTYLNLYRLLAFAECKQAFGKSQKILNLAFTIAVGLAYGLAAGFMDSSEMMVIGGGMMLYALIPLIIDGFHTMVTLAYNFPIPRAITFAAHGVLSGIVLSGLVRRTDVAEENVEKLKRVLEDFQVMSAGPDGVAGGGAGGGADGGGGPGGPPKKGKLAHLAGGLQPNKQCIGSDRTVSAAGCKNPLKMNRPNFDFGEGFDTLKTGSSLASDMADAASRGDMAAMDAAGGKINALSGKVKALNDKLRKKYNEKMKAEGRPQRDFDKEIKARVASFQGVMNNAMASKGINATVPTASISADPSKVKDSIGAVATKDAAPAAAPAAMDLSFNEETSEFASPDTVAKSGEGLDKYETDENDISKKSDVSIFIQLSNRYILNYTKIFDKKKDTPEAPK